MDKEERFKALMKMAKKRIEQGNITEIDPEMAKRIQLFTILLMTALKEVK